MRIELANCEATLLHEIADRRMKRLDVAKTYFLALRSSEADRMDWGRVNRAIIERWSPSALQWIKERAWRDTMPEAPAPAGRRRGREGVT